MWQTPESRVSPWNSTPLASSSRLASSTSGTRSAMCAVCGEVNFCPIASMSIR